MLNALATGPSYRHWLSPSDPPQSGASVGAFWRDPLPGGPACQELPLSRQGQGEQGTSGARRQARTPRSEGRGNRMRRHRSRSLPAIPRALVSLATLAIIVGSLTDPAQSRSRRHHHADGGNGGYQPPYAAIVVDANSGRVLHASNPDNLRHPASITKIMTLYLLFEQIEAGKLKLDSRLSVSSHAADQSPTKLELKPGQTIAVDDAIKGMVTKSANDAAVVVAEAIGGSEDNFGRLMTRKAHALGMTRTVYVNASGLPSADQLTTARDQAILGRA